MNKMKIVMLLVNILIIITIVCGFFVIKKLLSDNKSEENTDSLNTKRVNKYLYIVAALITFFSFVAMAIGIMSKITY